MPTVYDKTQPKHIAIIMDGNGRWAKQRNLQRNKGHEEGANTLRDITIHCHNIGIKYLTLYAFSTENWSRSKLEVEFLMKMLEKYLRKELLIYIKNNIRFKTIGDISKLSNQLQKTIEQTQDKTKNCTGLVQVLALNYGSRDEIVRTVKKLNNLNLEINESNINKYLDTNFMSDIDVLIRTSGEIRLSNYLLWQNAYSEMFFIDTLWPDFSCSILDNIIEKYKKRERRFGGEGK
jgi:undecaprenyl diphosphate synthase